MINKPSIFKFIIATKDAIFNRKTFKIELETVFSKKIMILNRTNPNKKAIKILINNFVASDNYIKTTEQLRAATNMYNLYDNIMIRELVIKKHTYIYTLLVKKLIKKYVEKNPSKKSNPINIVFKKSLKKIFAKHSNKTIITDEFILLNNKIKKFEILRLSAIKAIHKGVIKFESLDRMLIIKGKNLMDSVKNNEFEELSKYSLDNHIALLDVNQYIINKLKETYASFYELVATHNYVFLGEKWKNIPIIKESFNQSSPQSINVDIDGKTIKFPFQTDDLKELEFYTSENLPSKVINNKQAKETKIVNTRRVKKIMLLRVS